MLSNYLLTAWRHILKNKLYTGINLMGLVIGLSIYVFGSLLADYEQSHDMFYENAERIYTVGSVMSPTANIGVKELDGIFTAVAPFIISDVPELEAVARTVSREYLLTVGDDSYYESIRFADPALITIFDFNYVEGDSRALDDPSGMLITRTVAEKFFGEGPYVGRTMTLDHNVVLSISAVVEDLPKNTHFNSSVIIDAVFGIVAPLTALDRAAGYDLAGNWDNLSAGDLTYILVPQGKDKQWLQTSMDGVYDSHYRDDNRDFIIGLKVRAIEEANTVIWEMIGIPAIETVQLLALLVLVVAIVNYTNLATAQSLGRTREVGLRKTMGAGRFELLQQFLVESVTMACISMLFALALLELAVPAFNAAVGREMSINYLVTVPWLIATTLMVGLLAGAYPAYVITKTTPIEALRDGGKGTRSSLFRSIMLGLQFAISIFMLAMVLIVYFQNEKIHESSNIYPRSQILNLNRLDVEGIRDRHETLRNEISSIAGVESFAYSREVPYEQSNSAFSAGPEMGNEDTAFAMKNVRIDHEFLNTYNIPLIAGRNFDATISGDFQKDDVPEANVLVNEMAVENLGFGAASTAIGQVFYDFPDDRAARAYTIVGVVPSQNFQGFHNQIKPTVFLMNQALFRTASVRVSGRNMNDTLEEIEAVWQQLVPEYPLQTQFLNETFNDVFVIFSAMNKVLASFAAMALMLSMIGLFGLAAFMAASRTKEIGLCKVMGANIPQIVRLLIWQFSRPVLVAAGIALPLSWLASGVYLDFFADKLAMTEVIIVFAGVVAILFAWGIVAVHAVRIARANPIRALRYE